MFKALERSVFSSNESNYWQVIDMLELSGPILEWVVAWLRSGRQYLYVTIHRAGVIILFYVWIY